MLKDIKAVETYLNNLESAANNEKLSAASHVLELLGYDVRFNLLNNKYTIVGGADNDK